jgi:predicted ATPase
MILKRIVLQNFLSFRDRLSIDIDKNITVLLGSNDHGKSNLLRALVHLNEEVPITEDECNWDSFGPPSLSFEFELTAPELQKWPAAIGEAILEMEEEKKSLSSDTQNPRTEVVKWPQCPVRINILGPGILPTTPKATKREWLPVDVPASLLKPNVTTLTFSRTGVGNLLEIAGVPIFALPDGMSRFLDEGIPRVELFEVRAGEFSDAATAQSINSERLEPLQGVFFCAGIDPRNSEPLFKQNDKTIKALDLASELLNRNLCKLWGQGTSLTFQLRHHGSEIHFLADDPSIQTRKARMSKRSEGAIQFFRISMMLYARRMKQPGNSFIYLFDEPGVYLHPQGQRDLMQVFERIADENQLIYSTHSLFMLNQNFPARHRLIYKDKGGTKVDQKPYRQNWKLATDALGVYLTSNILFATKILLVEGDSDPIYIYELFRQLNVLRQIDVDLNSLGVMSFSDYQNLRFLIQLFKRNDHESSIMVLGDGDSTGKGILKRITDLAAGLNVPTLSLRDNLSIENYCLFAPQFLVAIRKAILNAYITENRNPPDDLAERIEKSWALYRGEPKLTAGRWFKDLAKELFGDEVSKVVLARNYVEACRELAQPIPDANQVEEATILCQTITKALQLPSVRGFALP